MSTPYPLKKFSTLLENVLTPPEISHATTLKICSKPLNNSQPPGIFLNPPENFTHTLKISQLPLIFLNPPPSPNIISTLLKNLNPSRKNVYPSPKNRIPSRKNVNPFRKNVNPASRIIPNRTQKISTRPPKNC